MSDFPQPGDVEEIQTRGVSVRLYRIRIEGGWFYVCEPPGHSAMSWVVEDKTPQVSPPPTTMITAEMLDDFRQEIEGLIAQTNGLAGIAAADGSVATAPPAETP